MIVEGLDNVTFTNDILGGLTAVVVMVIPLRLEN